jgi:hypothetical protein
MAAIDGEGDHVIWPGGRERRKSTAEKIVVRVDLEDEYGSCNFGVWNIVGELVF